MSGGSEARGHTTSWQGGLPALPAPLGFWTGRFLPSKSPYVCQVPVGASRSLTCAHRRGPARRLGGGPAARAQQQRGRGHAASVASLLAPRARWRRLPLSPNGAAHLLSSARTSACPQWGSGGLCPAAASSWPQWAWQPAGSCSPRPAWAPAPGLRRRNLRPSSDTAGAKPPRCRLQNPGAAAGRCFFKKKRTYSAENIPTEIIQFHLQNRGFMQKLSVI